MYDLGQESMLWYEEDGEHKDVHFEWMEIIWLYGAITMGMGKIW